MDNNLNTNELTPTEYFEGIKGKKNDITDKELSEVYDNCLILAQKYITTGQASGLKKLMFHLETIEKEREIVKAGVNIFIYKDDIEEYIDNVNSDVVKIIELEKYEREIPDEIVEVIKNTKEIFTQMYVLFTDYTGKIEKKIEKERRDKDPILFGTFQDKDSQTIIDRFYFLGDWVDEYCDLTLDKMVTETKNKTGKQIERRIDTPVSLNELKEQIKALESKPDGKFIVNNKNIKQSFFEKIRTFVVNRK